jgi:hypothetical protein
MMRFAPSREFYIPSGSVKIADKASDGIVYIYTSHKGRPAAMAFHGKAAKPDWHHSFASTEAREHKIREHFEGRRRWSEWKQERRDERKKPHVSRPVMSFMPHGATTRPTSISIR